MGGKLQTVYVFFIFLFFGFFSYMNILPIQILILEVFLSVNLTLYNLKY